ncbi:hypothetical protein RBH26_12905 [Natronolimnohabitans sp. A-GB9]|uniref:hypothetical protein n=1 Tax=Natronolimnohabitans sp. A-GB9 TaxID=3069757 RepID=UPI0027AF9E0C|nr:hypothetical protein [Natronolimnohabitans sp. A-GB9]MDQ2051375.1 hypothetical protein [Natronolimnohabitans sp. A-GB9]
MVTDRTRGRRSDDRSADDRPDRGQVILIGAIALAFIILGVVVVFNGVVYTETLSSGETGQSASSAETTELEVRQGIACLLDGETGDDDLEETYTGLYQNATAHSQPAAVDIEVEGSDRVTITYDTTDLSYERTVEISAECTETDESDEGNESNEGDGGDESDEGDTKEMTINTFEITPEDNGDHSVEWDISGDEISTATLTITYTPHQGNDDTESQSIDITEDHSGDHTFSLNPNDDVQIVEIVVTDENGRTESDEWPEE